MNIMQKRVRKIPSPLSNRPTAALNPVAPPKKEEASLCGKTMQISAIKLDYKIQGRASLNKATIKRYAELMQTGVEFPRIVVFQVEGENLLSDGWHRYYAAQKAGMVSLEVELRQGTRVDAVKHGIQANHGHGLPFTNKDKQRCVQLALENFPDLSDRAIAALVSVSQPFVGSVRQLKTVISSGPRLGRDGKRRRLAKARNSSIPGKQQPAKAGPNSATAVLGNHDALRSVLASENLNSGSTMAIPPATDKAEPTPTSKHLVWGAVDPTGRLNFLTLAQTKEHATRVANFCCIVDPLLEGFRIQEFELRPV